MNILSTTRFRNLDDARGEPIHQPSCRLLEFRGLRLVPRPLQQPSPPVWVTVVSTASARKAARRGAKICPGFHPNEKVKEIYDANRDEASKFGRPAGPDQLALRRQVAIALTEEVASRAISTRRDQPEAATPRFDTADLIGANAPPDELNQ